jgi:hypothetical protein
MMKKFLLIILLVDATFSLTAQQKPSFIGLQAGTSIPVGKFQSKELEDGGFAQAGFSTSIEGAWFFKSWLGAGGSAGFHLHPVDISTLGYEKMKDNPFLKSLTIRSEPYLSLSLYGGLFFQFPVANKLAITAKAMGGLLYAQTPYQLYKAEYEMLGDNWYDITSAGDFEGSFLLGAGLRYDLNGCLGFALNSEFTYNQCDFNFSLPGGSVRTDHKVISFVNLAMGVVFKI